MLAPLWAMDSAAGRVRTNHGETISLTAAAPIAAQLAPLNSVATKSCQGAVALAQPTTPTAKKIEPAFVAAGTPKRIWSVGKLATTTAPMTKCVVTAVEIKATGQPLFSWIVCK